MQLEPSDLFEKLEFDKIKQLVAKECLGELGAEAVQRLHPMSNPEQIEEHLREVAEYKLSIAQNDRFPTAAYFDIEEDLKLLEVRESVLPQDGLQRINIILLFIRDIFKFFTEARRETYPYLYNIVRAINFDEGLIDEIEKVIDEEGDIRPDASPALLKIRKTIGGKQKELDKTFRSIINTYRNKGWLTDNVESFRNNRRVLSVPSEHKRKIRGIIHDESATGKTAFIEPDGIIDINNDIFDLEQREKREVYRILKDLSAILRPYVPLMRIYQTLLVRFDVIYAKARLAVNMKGRLPKLKDKPTMRFLEGYHPLLLLKNKQAGKKTVPFTLDLYGKNRLLMLSGPNAGGKSITMKAVGLMQLMIQSGLLVPVDEESEFGIFDAFFVDMGDQQSIEDDLSTYSSRLKNMRTFLEKATKRSLVLIDEFGSGTDPKIGGAIAEAILRELNFVKVHGIITTHYSNLKVFAFKNQGIVNGSMHFDKDTLSPTYELKVGRPGSSYAYEIAEKSGLPAKILKYARHRTGKNEKAVDELLVDLQAEQQELREELDALRQKEQKLERLIKTYESMHQDLEVRRKRLKLEAKEQELQLNASSNRDFDQLIRELKEQRNLEKAKEEANRVKQRRQALVEEVKDLREDIYYEPPKKKASYKPITTGDFVKFKTGGATGYVESVEKDKAVVQMGEMRMTIPIRDLQQANEPLEQQKSRSVKTETVPEAAGFQNKMDIRGMRYDEALRTVEEFVDQALMSSASKLEIVHGKGTGVLRQAVRKKLREYNISMDIRHPEPEMGGDGVTLVEIL